MPFNLKGLKMNKDKITPKEVCDAGIAMSFGEARRLLQGNIIRHICSQCGSCRCSSCLKESEKCRLCGSTERKLDRKGGKHVTS